MIRIFKKMRSPLFDFAQFNSESIKGRCVETDLLAFGARFITDLHVFVA